MAENATQRRGLYIIGPQCTGKTTLVNALEESFQQSAASLSVQGTLSKPVVIREVARTVLKDKQFSRHDITTSPTRALQLQKHILDAQFVAEAAAVGLPASIWYISDRSGLDPIIYTKLFVGDDAADEMLKSETWEQLEGRMKAGIVMLCEAGCSWLVDDGTRLMPNDTEQWMRLDSAFREQLALCGIRYTLIPKDMELRARVQLVQEHLRRSEWPRA